MLLVLALTAPAAAADCGRDILDDWQDNNVVDRHYPTLCYPLAFAQMPQDAEQYSSIVADVRRAEQRDRRREQGGQTPDVPAPTPEELEERGVDTTATPPPPPPADTDAPPPVTDAATTAATDTGATPGGGSTGGGSDLGEADDTGVFGDLIGAGGTDRADEVPAAVKVLGGAAALLLAVGAAGLVAQRRSQGRG